MSVEEFINLCKATNLIDIGGSEDRFRDLVNSYDKQNYFGLIDLVVYMYCLRAVNDIEFAAEINKLVDLVPLINRYSRLHKEFKRMGKRIIEGAINYKGSMKEYRKTKEYQRIHSGILKIIIQCVGWYDEDNKKLKVFGKVYSGVDNIHLDRYGLRWSTPFGSLGLIVNMYSNQWEVIYLR